MDDRDSAGQGASELKPGVVARSGEYTVSMSRGGGGDRFSAWYGRTTRTRVAGLIGVRDTLEAAKQLCRDHAIREGKKCQESER